MGGSLGMRWTPRADRGGASELGLERSCRLRLLYYGKEKDGAIREVASVYIKYLSTGDSARSGGV